MKKILNRIKSVRLRSLLLYLLVVSFVLTGVSFARFGVSKNASDGAASAATFTVTKGTASTATQSVYLTSDTDAVATQNTAFLSFKVTSTSEVPVTYNITVTAPSGDVLPDGLEWYLTPVNTSASDYATVVANAKAGKKNAGTHTHRPNGAQTVTYTGCGIAPAGTHTQEYLLHIHYETVNNTTNSGNYTFSGMVTQYIPGITITATARDARDNATANGTLNTTDFESNYTE